MKIRAIFISLLFGAVTLTSNEAKPFDLSPFQWRNRLLLLFAPDAKDSALQNMQSQISAQNNEVKDRDLVVFEVLENGPSRMNSSRLDQKTADSLRNRFDAPPGKFTLILVGKDGGVKFQGENLVRLEKIFERIDSMPMRQYEMRRKAK